jgi:PKD repeat protein
MRLKILLPLLVLTGAACNKGSDVNLPKPTAGFSVNGYTVDSVITIGTYDQDLLINTSGNATSYLWNFGNDSTSTAVSPVLWYPKSGTYTLTLTALNEAGAKASFSMKVKVLDRVMQQVSITGLLAALPIPHSLMHAKVWAVIKLGQNGVTYPLPTTAGQSLNAPVIYQTPVIPDFDSTRIPYTFSIPGKMIVNFPALATLSEQGLGYTGVGYGLEIYAQDATGTYLVSTSYQFFYVGQSGSISWPVADIARDLFIFKYSSMQVLCDYE